MELFLKNWYHRFFDELQNTKELKIISPFVKKQIIYKIQRNFDFKNFELITRFNLQDFALKVSSLNGLKFSVENGAKVYGINGLHSKVYLFDNRAAIITSANLTSGGLINNYECGIFLTDVLLINNLHDYFNSLKSYAKNKLTIEDCEEWEQKLREVIIPKGENVSLPDFGARASNFDKEKNYYIKFFGKSNHRVPLDFIIKKEIEGALCHYACGFPKNKKPRQINEGDIIFMARMTTNPEDYSVFGRAIAMKYTEGRDVASKKEIEQREWKAQWPIYLRVKNPVFIDGVLEDGILLSDLLERFDYNSFPSTKKRFDNGERGIKPTKSLMRKAYVKLTYDSAEWLEQKFTDTLNNTGKVDDEFIEKLPQTTTDINAW